MGPRYQDKIEHLSETIPAVKPAKLKPHTGPSG
jgi:hypothetical protein